MKKFLKLWKVKDINRQKKDEADTQYLPFDELNDKKE